MRSALRKARGFRGISSQHALCDIEYFIHMVGHAFLNAKRKCVQEGINIWRNTFFRACCCGIPRSSCLPCPTACDCPADNGELKRFPYFFRYRTAIVRSRDTSLHIGTCKYTRSSAPHLGLLQGTECDCLPVFANLWRWFCDVDLGHRFWERRFVDVIIHNPKPSSPMRFTVSP